MILKIKENIFKNLPNSINEEIYNKTNLIYKKMINKDNKPSDILELFDNINILLEASEEDIELKNKLKTIKTLKEFTDIFNEYSIFNQLDETFEYKATGKGGTPDTAILIKTDKGFKIKFSAASHVADANYEGLQLFRHPMKLQLSLDKALEIFKKEGNDNPTIIELTEKINSLYKEKKIKDNKEIINDNSIENIDSDIDLLNYIDNLEIEELIPLIDINGTYSNRDILFIKENIQNKKQFSIIKKMKENNTYNSLSNKNTENKENVLEVAIEEISQWMMIVSQFSSIYNILNENIDYKGDKNKLENKITDIIDKLMKKMTFTKETSLGLSEIGFKKTGLNTKDGVEKLLTIIADYTTEYDIDNVIKKEKVLNNKQVLTNFVKLTSFIKRNYSGDEEISKKLDIVQNIIGQISNDLIIYNLKIKNEEEVNDILNIIKENNEDKYNEYLKLNKDKHEIIKEFYLENIRELNKTKNISKSLENFALDEVEENKKYKKYMEEELERKEKEKIRVIKNVLNEAPDRFKEEFYIHLKKSNINHESFLRIIEGIGKISSDIDGYEDIKNIIYIFNNLTTILDVKIEEEDMRNLFNEILMQSFNDEIIDYDTFIEIMAIRLEEISTGKEYANSKIAESISNLKSNVSLNKDENGKSLRLSKIIINKVKQMKSKGNSKDKIISSTLK
jgi:hypothetical protein